MTKALVIVAILVAALSGYLLGRGDTTPRPAGPNVVAVTTLLCPEDAVIVGQGNYTGGRGWDSYVCIPLDDLTGGIPGDVEAL